MLLTMLGQNKTTMRRNVPVTYNAKLAQSDKVSERHFVPIPIQIIKTVQARNLDVTLHLGRLLTPVNK
jgi:hypothetical protein